MQENEQFSDSAIDFPDFGHLCCDVCACVCICEDLPNEDFQFGDIELNTKIAVAPKHIQKSLTEKLLVHRKVISTQLHRATVLVGVDLCTGLTDQTIKNIAISKLFTC